ncbi:MAG TPA: hypothetical protein VKR31_00875 [Rhizomicrobium sp.]|nr:hypothetical protein [Rhizomicrobium sp.]
MANEKKFFCVYGFDTLKTDYECVGAFTLRADAEAFSAACDAEAAGDSKQYTRFPVVTRTMAEMIDAEIKVRLGRLADILFEKEQAELDARQQDAERTGASIAFASRQLGNFRELYTHGKLPVHVSKRS